MAEIPGRGAMDGVHFAQLRLTQMVISKDISEARSFY